MLEPALNNRVRAMAAKGFFGTSAFDASATGRLNRRSRKKNEKLAIPRYFSWYIATRKTRTFSQILRKKESLEIGSLAT